MKLISGGLDEDLSKLAKAFLGEKHEGIGAG